MFRKSLLAAGLVAASISTASAVPYGFFDARSVAMGNTSVATGSITTAAFSNPAMLAINEKDDSFALLVPAVGVQVVDTGGMVDLIDEFQVLSNITTPTISDINQMIAIAAELDGTGLQATATGNAALVFAGDNFTMGFSYHGVAQANGFYLETVPGVPGVSAPQGEFRALGYSAQEIGVSFATKLSVLGMEIALGVTPKTVQVDSVYFNQSIDIVDTGNAISDAVESDLGSFTTVDAGVAIDVLDTLTVGVVAKNLIEKSVSDGFNTFDFDTHVRAGASFHTSFLTISADMDLTEIDPVSINDSPSQMMAVGAEFNVLDFMQLRAGYQTNIASGTDDPDLISAGVGLWLGFHLDAAVVVGEDDSLGAFVQTGFRF